MERQLCGRPDVTGAPGRSGDCSQRVSSGRRLEQRTEAPAFRLPCQAHPLEPRRPPGLPSGSGQVDRRQDTDYLHGTGYRDSLFTFFFPPFPSGAIKADRKSSPFLSNAP